MKRIFAAVILTFLSATAHASWTVDSNTYTTRKAITIDNTYVDSDLTNFPLLVMISSDSDIGAVCQADGDDLRFTASDGTTLLNHEMVSFSVSGGAATGEMWVQVPTVAGASDTTIYVYYGDSGASAYASPENTWETNYKLVLHLSDNAASTAVFDSTTGHSPTANRNTSLRTTTGKIGNSLIFTHTSSDIITVPDSADWDLDAADFYVSYWVKVSTGGNYGEHIARDSSSSNVPFTFGYNSGGFLCFMAKTSGSFSDLANSKAMGSNTIDTWFHQVIRRVGSNFYTYQDSVQKATWSDASAVYTSSNALSIGKSNIAGIGSYLGGNMDEIRFVRGSGYSADWVKFEYRNMVEADHEIALGSEETSSASTSRRSVIVI